jgi:hypothetical protein
MDKIPIRIKLYFKDERELRRIEIEMRNVVIRLPPSYYKKYTVYNPISGFDMPLKQFPIIVVYKRKLF